MSASQFDTLIELARNSRDQAGLSLANERKNEQQTVAQVESLGRYRQEYAQRLQTSMRQGIDPASMYNYQQFLASLDAALVKARQALAAQQQRVTQSQQYWQQEQRKLSSYDTLASRRAAEQQRNEQQREQKTSDDLVNGRLARRLADTHSH
ncbi:flagellar export protein FliJ [Vreelandella rituensis]|uniref:Flagellar FliJ protein n=1 Tax=Vreelandella rituensis TaxID=2282306 RepID=A0A368TQI6_9GAMM|nr:flagellar export protein FliJ [Halomonas rituensis]RCV86985.1 flagellar export protein FliJ [Halomonas rituensis]